MSAASRRLLLTCDASYGVLAAVRALRARGYEPWVALTARNTYAGKSRAAAGSVIVPDPAVDVDGFVAALSNAADRFSVSAVLPGNEHALLALAGRDGAFPAGTALGVPSVDVVQRAVEKDTVIRLAADVGLETPPTIEIDADDLQRDSAAISYPAVVKPLRSQTPLDGELRHGRAMRVEGPAELRRAVASLPGRAWLLQPYLSDKLSAMCGVAWNGAIIAAEHQVARRIWPPDCGISAYAVTVPPDRELERAAARLIERIGWSGVFQLQFVYSQGRPYFIDLNPRIYGSLALAVAAGVNLPAIWADCLLGIRPVVTEYRAGMGFRAEENDARALLRAVSAGEWRSALEGVLPRKRTVHAVFSAKDPKPFLTALAKLRRIERGPAKSPSIGPDSPPERSRQRHKKSPRLEHAGTLAALRDEWTQLAEETGNIFATWEWSAIWWRHFGRDRSLLLTAVRDAADSLVAVLPLYCGSVGPLRVVRFLGHGDGDELGPVCTPAAAGQAAAALRRTLPELPCRWDIFLGEQLSGDHDWAASIGAKTVSRTGNPVIRSDGASWEEYLAAKSGNFRAQVRQFERRLARRHELVYRLANDPDRLQQDLDLLFALHGQRWGAHAAFSDSSAAFHREFATTALERGWLRLWFLELDGEAAAAWYGFRFGGVEAAYQSGRDPRWERFSVGRVLIAHTVREALADGVNEYRLLRGGEAYKYRFATEDPGLKTIALPRGIVGRAALSLALVARAQRGEAGPRRTSPPPEPVG